MKLHTMFVWERFPTAIKIDRIPLFDVRCLLVYAFHLDGFGHVQRRRARSASACAACAPRVGYCD